jgi:hypothetical protein
VLIDCREAPPTPLARTGRSKESLVAVHESRLWHIRDIARSQIEVRFRCRTGHTADITAMTGFDPGCVKTLEAFVGAQQKNRTCGLSESFMRGRHPVRTYLLPERPAKWFSRNQDPKRTLSYWLWRSIGWMAYALRVCPGLHGIWYNDHIEGDGQTAFRHACKLGLEGIVSKRKDSPYRSGRSPDWLKMKNPAHPAVKRETDEDWGG